MGFSPGFLEPGAKARDQDTNLSSRINAGAPTKEAAQVKFSNPTMMVAEAIRHGYLVPAGGQMKQLSAIGEEFVRLLPDRKAAIEAIRHAKPRRPRKRNPGQKEGRG